MNHSKLDLAFVLDTTGSMGSYIQHAKDNINKIADEIRRSEKCDLNVGIVNYRDHPPQDRTYVTQIHHLTNEIGKTRQFINKTQASGGGDFPEAVCCGLNDCLNSLKWRNDAVKVVILIADAPPHGLGVGGDGLPNGCPKKKDPVEIAHEMAARGITLYTAGCEPSLTPYRQFFIALSLITGGQYVPLNNSARLTEVIVGGAREDISMEKLMAQVHEEYFKEIAEKGGRVDEDELTKRIHKVLNSSSEAKINSLTNFEAIKITDETKELGKQTTLKNLVDYAKKNKINLQDHTNTTFTGVSSSISLASSGRTVTVGKPFGLHSVFSSAPLFPLEKKKIEDDESDEESGGIKKRLRSSSSATKASPRGRAAKVASITTTVKEEEPKKEEAKVEEATTKVADTEIKTDETVNIDQARRLVKKVIARNK